MQWQHVHLQQQWQCIQSKQIILSQERESEIFPSPDYRYHFNRYIFNSQYALTKPPPKIVIKRKQILSNFIFTIFGDCAIWRKRERKKLTLCYRLLCLICTLSLDIISFYETSEKECWNKRANERTKQVSEFYVIPSSHIYTAFACPHHLFSHYQHTKFS